MYEIIGIVYIKSKIFLSWVLTGAVFHYFEIQTGRFKFNFWKCCMSLIIFWILTEFAHLMIQWNFIDTDIENEARVLVVSIMLASFLYLFIPFVLQKENRNKFIEWVLNKFWFIKNEKSWK